MVTKGRGRELFEAYCFETGATHMFMPPLRVCCTAWDARRDEAAAFVGICTEVESAVVLRKTISYTRHKPASANASLSCVMEQHSDFVGCQLDINRC